MCGPVGTTRFLAKLLPTALVLVWDAFRFIKLNLRSRQTLAAENLFLRKQLALYLESKAKPGRAQNGTHHDAADLVAKYHQNLIFQTRTSQSNHSSGRQLHPRSCRSFARRSLTGLTLLCLKPNVVNTKSWLIRL